MVATSSLPVLLDAAAAVLAGDRDGPDRLLTAVRPRLVGYLRTRVDDLPGYGGVDDVVQDVCVAVLEGLPAFRGTPGQLLHWLFRVAYQVQDSHTRHRACAARRVTLVDQVPDTPDPDSDPEQHALLAEQLVELRALLDYLPAGEYEALVLAVDGLSPSEVAAELGRSPVTVRVAQTRGRARLRALLTDPTKRDARRRRRSRSASGGVSSRASRPSWTLPPMSWTLPPPPMSWTLSDTAALDDDSDQAVVPVPRPEATAYEATPRCTRCFADLLMVDGSWTCTRCCSTNLMPLWIARPNPTTSSLDTDRLASATEPAEPR